MLTLAFSSKHASKTSDCDDLYLAFIFIMPDLVLVRRITTESLTDLFGSQAGRLFFCPELFFVCYPSQLHMAEHPAGHLVLKWLIEQDVMLAEAGKEGKKKNKQTQKHTHTHTL